MKDKLIINIIFNACGFIILLPSVLPVISPHYGYRSGQRKRKFAIYSALLHLFVLSCLISGEAYQIGSPSSDLGTTLSIVSVFPAVISATMLIAGILCDENGVIRIPKGRKMPSFSSLKNRMTVMSYRLLFTQNGDIVAFRF